MTDAPHPAHAGQRVWVVDDDRAVRFVLSTALRDAGYQVEGFDSAAAALDALTRQAVPVLLFTDVRMPGDDGLVLLDKLKAAHPQLPVIVMSAYTDVASTAGAFRGGAHEFLSKPFDLDDAVALARRALPGAEALLPDDPDPGEPGQADQTPQLVGDTPPMRALFRAIGKLAQAPLAVLITGETGTGKELVASALHRESPRSRAPFVALNTAAIPAELLESELFGHEAGAFTGAQRRHVGRFEQADGGTLFLDEIGDMPLALQTRLLRVMAEGEVAPLGAAKTRAVDIHVICASHRDLSVLVSEGRFREDLFFRLGCARFCLPPLRERTDKLALINRLLEQEARNSRVSVGIAPSALQLLLGYAWPGNVRQLRHVLAYACAVCEGGTVQVADLPVEVRGEQVAAPTEDRASPERQVVLDALIRHRWKPLPTAQALGISRATLYRRVNQLGIDMPGKPRH